MDPIAVDPLPADTVMTVDYDPVDIDPDEVLMDPVVEAGDGDAEMGEEETRLGEVEEADMREYDEEVEVLEEVMGEVGGEVAAAEGFDTVQATEDDAAFSLPSPTPVVYAPAEIMPESTASPSLPAVGPAAVADVSDSATDPVAVEPSTALAEPVPEPTSEYTTVVEPTEVEQPAQETADSEATGTLDAPRLDEASITEEGDYAVVPPTADSTTKLSARDSTPRSATRPSIKNSLLSLVSLPTTLTSASPTSSSPAVLLSFNNDTYSLFQRYTSGPAVLPEMDESLPVLFEDEVGQALYWGPVEELMDALHDALPGFSAREEEIVLKFEDLGIDLSEDNAHTAEVSLSDFDRVHVGCGVPGRLHVSLETAPRFSTGFNALVDHIVNTYRAETTGASDDVDLTAPIEGMEELENATVAELEAMLRAASEEGSEGGETYEERAGGGETYEGGEGAQGEGEYEDGEWAEEAVEYEEGGEPYDLDEALAELGSDDLVAVIEGAQEDYIESEGQEGEDYAAEKVELEAVAGEEGGDQEGLAAAEIEDADTPQFDDGLVVEEIIEEQPATTSATTELSLAVDSLSPSTTAPGSNGLNFSYDTPLGTGLEAPAIPLPSSTTTILEAAASNSGAQVEEVEATGDIAEDVDEVVAENDVVIDYEEVFDPSTSLPSPSLAATSISEPTSTSCVSEDILLSPKRSHSSLRDASGLADDEADAKRPRLADLVSPA